MINKNILKKSKNSVLERDLYKAYKLFFNTFSSEQRLKILNLLRKKTMNVSEIIRNIGYEQSVVSHNLKRLKNCGFVDCEVRGKFRHYKINSKTIEKILNLIDKHMKKHCLLIVKGLKGGNKM